MGNPVVKSVRKILDEVVDDVLEVVRKSRNLDPRVAVESSGMVSFDGDLAFNKDGGLAIRAEAETQVPLDGVDAGVEVAGGRSRRSAGAASIEAVFEVRIRAPATEYVGGQ